MTEPLLTVAANGHLFLTFEEFETPQWQEALTWLANQAFQQTGDTVKGLDEALLPSFVRHTVSIAAGYDNWAGSYLLAECLRNLPRQADISKVERLADWLRYSMGVMPLSASCSRCSL